MAMQPFPVLLRDVNPSQWFRLIVTSAQAACSSPSDFGGFPENAVNARGFLAFIRGHSFYCQQLGVERMGQQVLQGFNLVPPVYRAAFAFSDLLLSPLHLPALRSACHASRSWRSDDFSTFHVIILTDNLGAV